MEVTCLHRSGDVRTVGPVDRETQGGLFIITVLAISNSNGPTTTSSCQVGK